MPDPRSRRLDAHERLLMLICYAVTVAAWIALFLMSDAKG